MRRASVTVMAVLTLAVACAGARAEEASVLLEAGVYAEEVVGDLDRAIETYRKIIADAEANRPCVAEAHYRLGKCYLARGDEAKAREQFARVVQRYPDQAKLAEAAQRELAKLRTADHAGKADPLVQLRAWQPERRRHFVRLVVGRDMLTFEGRATTWEELPELLEHVPNREHTTFQLARGPHLEDGELYENAKAAASQFVDRYGLEVLSLAGEHPLGTIGSPTKVLFPPGAPYAEAPLSVWEGEKPGRPRYFVRLIVGPNALLFEGRETTWEQLPELLEHVPDRQWTVLQLSQTPDLHNRFPYQEAVPRARQFVGQLGFEYLSFAGEVSFTARGSRPVLVEAEKRDLVTPTQGEPTFGPVVERVVNDAARVGMDCMIDFETGRLFSASEVGPPQGQEPDREAVTAAIRQLGIDAYADTDQRSHGLALIETLCAGAGPEGWDAGPAEVVRQFEGRTVPAFDIEAGTPTGFMRAPENLPATLFFKTREGEIGVLQIVEFTENPRGVKIRYKLVQPARGRRVVVPEVDASMRYLDLSTGRLLTLPHGMGEEQVMDRFRAQGGHFVMYEARSLILPIGTVADHGLRPAAGEPFLIWKVPEELPRSLEITTTGGVPYRITVLAADEDGCELEYRRIGASEPLGAGLSPDAAARLTELRMQLADAKAELSASEATVRYWQTEIERTEPLAQAGRADATEVERARLELSRARAAQEAARQKAEILTQEIARLEAEPGAAPAPSDAGRLTDLRIQLADAKAEVVGKEAQLKAAHGAFERTKESHSEGRANDGSYLRAEAEYIGAKVQFEAAHEKVEILTHEIARLLPGISAQGPEGPFPDTELRRKVGREEKRRAILEAMYAVGVAMEMYKADHNGTFPPDPGELEKGGYLPKEDSPFRRWPELRWRCVIPQTMNAGAVVLYHWPPVDGEVTVLHQDQAVQSIKVGSDGVLRNPRTGEMIATAAGNP